MSYAGSVIGATINVASRRRVRYLGLAALDVLSAIVSISAALFLRMNGQVPAMMVEALLVALPIVAITATLVFHAVGLYRRAWRYTSTRDLPVVLLAATAAIAASAAILSVTGLDKHLPTSVPIIQWFILVAGLTGARLARRVATEKMRARRQALRVVGGIPTGASKRVILIGEGDRVELALRQIEADPAAAFVPVGILDEVAGHLKLRMRGVPVLGGPDALELAVKKLAAENRRPDCIMLVDDPERLAGAKLVKLVNEAESLGLAVARLPAHSLSSAAAAGQSNAAPAQLDYTYLDVAALLGRPPVTSDPSVVASFVARQRVLVTGAGGTIGRELVRQIAAAGPSELILIDACEFNLYSIDQELQENYPDVPRSPVMCSIRQRGAVMAAFAKYRPNLVFHAAALKHVPLVEANPCAGVQTNVLGTRNVADAARRFGVRAMVQVSTDKAVNPVGVMGATKRLGELYCQALDLAGADCAVAPRFLTVRFGNVLGSSGSLVPLFQRQLSRRAPLTVTHPEIRRYFMTVHEAVHLILQGTARALELNSQRGRIFVLDMGEPIPIIEIARRMIRLAGLEPGRDVKIEIVGLRPGEKLYEELFDTTERKLESELPGIFEAEPVSIPIGELDDAFNRLNVAAAADDAIAVRAILADILRPATVTHVGFDHHVPDPAVAAQPVHANAGMPAQALAAA